MTQSSSSDNFASNDNSQREGVEQLLDVHGECQKTDVDHEPTAPECPTSKVGLESSSHFDYAL